MVSGVNKVRESIAPGHGNNKCKLFPPELTLSSQNSIQRVRKGHLKQIAFRIGSRNDQAFTKYALKLYFDASMHPKRREVLGRCSSMICQERPWVCGCAYHQKVRHRFNHNVFRGVRSSRQAAHYTPIQFRIDTSPRWVDSILVPFDDLAPPPPSAAGAPRGGSVAGSAVASVGPTAPPAPSPPPTRSYSYSPPSASSLPRIVP